MFFNVIIRRCVFCAATFVAAEAKPNEENEDKEEKIIICRPSELPIYIPEPPQILMENQEDKEELETPDFIQNSVRTLRLTLANYKEEYYAYKKVANQSFDEGKQNVESLIDYLRQEENVLPKAGAIGIGALTGLIFGLRGGFFKKTIYASTGALSMAALCYPKEATEYTLEGIKMIKELKQMIEEEKEKEKDE